jgi:hypothetical protein
MACAGLKREGKPSPYKCVYQASEPAEIKEKVTPDVLEKNQDSIGAQLWVAKGKSWAQTSAAAAGAADVEADRKRGRTPDRSLLAKDMLLAAKCRTSDWVGREFSQSPLLDDEAGLCSEGAALAQAGQLDQVLSRAGPLNEFQSFSR